MSQRTNVAWADTNRQTLCHWFFFGKNRKKKRGGKKKRGKNQGTGTGHDSRMGVSAIIGRREDSDGDLEKMKFGEKSVVAIGNPGDNSVYSTVHRKTSLV